MILPIRESFEKNGVFGTRLIGVKTSYNGTVCTVKRDGRPGGVQMVTFTEKLTNLKYELLMAYFDRDIKFLSFVLIECRNMIIYEIFISAFKIIIRFVRKYVSKVEISFIHTIWTTLDMNSAEVQ